MPIVPGTKLGPYLVQDYVGQGAMGVVYRCYHAQLERTGAVKVLQGLSPDSDSVARFRREAQAIAHMRHPNIVNVFDFGEYEGTPYMIVEFVEGGSLSNVVKSGPIERKVMLEYLRGIASALDYAHSRGIIHRDVKPANVLLAADNSPILADFGLAKLMESSSIKSVTGVTTGTPAYMAPEQVTGSQVGPASDRYSLAVMAYEMLTGFLPFDQGGVLEVLYAQVHRTPDPPSARSSKLGTLVDAVVMRGLAKDPAARWPSCDAFVKALEEALNQRTVRATERTIAFAPPVPSAPAPPAPAPLPAAHRAPAPDATVVVGSPAGFGFEEPRPIPGPDAAILKHPPRNRRRLWMYAAAAAALIVVLVLVSTAAYLIINRPATLTVSRTQLSPGDSLVVSASHVPDNQVGDIELFSVLHRYPFKADGNGNVRGTIFLPTDLDPGPHTLKICWNQACHASVQLNVVAGPVSLASPSSDASPSPTLGAPTASPSAKATPTLGGPTASPSPKATPNPSCSPALALGAVSSTKGYSVTFQCFATGTSWNLTVWWKPPLLGWQSKYEATVVVGGPSYSVHESTPALDAIHDNTYVTACRSSCVYSNVQATGA